MTGLVIICVWIVPICPAQVRRNHFTKTINKSSKSSHIPANAPLRSGYCGNLEDDAPDDLKISGGVRLTRRSSANICVRPAKVEVFSD